MGQTVITVLLTPIILLLAALTALMFHNVLTQTTVAISRSVGFPLRRLLGIQSELKTLGVISAFGLFGTFITSPLVFIGMLWNRYAGGGEFFLYTLAVVIPAWFLLRILFVVATGEPNAPQPQPRERRHTVLARRRNTIPTPEGAELKKDHVFMKVKLLKWDYRHGVHIDSYVEQVPLRDFGIDDAI